MHSNEQGAVAIDKHSGNDSLLKKIQSNLISNQLLESVVDQRKVKQPAITHQRWTSAFSKRSNIVSSRGVSSDAPDPKHTESTTADVGLTSRRDQRTSAPPPPEQRVGDINMGLSQVAIDRRLQKSLGRSRSRPRGGSVDNKVVLTQTYYMKALQYHLGLKQKTAVSKVYCEHFLQSIAAIKYIQTLRPVSDEAIYKSQVSCPRIEESELHSRPKY